MPRPEKALTTIALLCAVFGASAQEAIDVDPRYTWDLTELFETASAWDAAREGVQERLPEIQARRGTLGESAASLYGTLASISDLQREALEVFVWASLGADEDLRASEPQARRQLAQGMFSRFGEATAWLQPELLEVGEARIQRFLDEDERLERFRFELENTLRNAPHTLTPEAEQALSYFGQAHGAPQTIRGTLANADIPWPTLTLSTGEEGIVDSAGYSRFRGAANREDRKRVFDAYWSTWLDYRNSVGQTLVAHLQTQVALAKARGYDSVLQRELFADDIPEAVYRTLVEEVNAALPTLHRYFTLRARMLGVDEMRYYDIYPPLVSLDKTFEIEASIEITLDAMAILGEDWVSRQRAAMSQRWMHVFPSRGKRSGAYMSGAAYDVHPYLLLNHNDDYESLSTLAHEWGHAMHTLYAKDAQPFDTAFYSTFIAEIPSTSLELILLDHMLEEAEDDDERLFYLGSALEGMRGTFFRQTMFAEFELSLYEAVERGEALTGARMSEMYGELLRRYHGHDEGVVVIDELYENEWMFIPHFFLNMYVYQYATSQTAGTALYAKIVEEGEAGVENYENLLRAGGSDHPYNLLTRAGVDMATPEPYRAAIAKMNAIMDEMESILARREAVAAH